MKVEAQALPPGDSGEQRRAEKLIVDAVAATLGIRAHPREFVLASGNRITVDGYSADPPALIEAWAHIGRPKSAQKAKVMVDALKLHWLRSTVLPGARCVLALADEDAASHFVSTRTWMADCLRQLDIDVVVARLPPETRAELREAQTRQYR